MRQSIVKGSIYGIIAAICYGTNPLGALFLYKENFQPESVLFYRFAFAILFLGIVMLVEKKSFKINRREFFILASLGFLFGVSSLTYYVSFNYMDAGLSSTLLFLYPVEVAIIMGVLFKEKISLKKIVSIAIALCGVILLYKGSGDLSISAMGFLFVFISSITYAVYIVILNRAELKMGSVKLTFYALIFCLITISSYSIFWGCGLPPILNTVSSFGWACMLGLVPTFLSLVFMTKAVKLIGSTPTAIMGALEPLTAVFIGVLVFNEILITRLVLGIVLILSAVILIVVEKRTN